MAEQSTVDMVEKLIRLATNNPSEQEAKAAALKACELIMKFSIPLGAEVVIVKDREWTPPSSDFMNMVDEILKGEGAQQAWKAQQDAARAAYDGNGPDVPGGIMIQDRDLMTREDAFRAQMKRAWQAIREERKRFEAWVHEMRVKHHLNFWDADHPKPWGDK